MKRILFVVLLTGIAILAFPKDQDTVSFVIAPPPVGYPVFEAGYTDWMVGGNFIYLHLEVMDSTFHAYGGTLFGNWQYCVSNRFALSGNLGAALLLGDSADLTIIQIPLQFNAAYEIPLHMGTSLFLLGGIGGDIGILSMDGPVVPQYLPYTSTIFYDHTTLETLTTTGHVSGGLQLNLGLGSFVFSPFGIYAYTAGTYSTDIKSSVSYLYPSSSGSIDGYSTTIIGFDLLYRPWGVSLSSLFHHRDTSDLFSIALKWLLSHKQ